MTRGVQHPRCADKGAQQSIHVDALNVDVAARAARLARPHHIDSPPTRLPPGPRSGSP